MHQDTSALATAQHLFADLPLLPDHRLTPSQEYHNRYSYVAITARRPLAVSPCLAGRLATAAAPRAALRHHAAAVCRVWNTGRARPTAAEGQPEAATGAGAEPRILVFNETTVSPQNRAISTALQPWREARAVYYEKRAAQAQWYAGQYTKSQPKAREAGQWYRERAKGLQRSIAQNLSACGHKVAELLDHATGEVVAVPVGCQQPTCAHCRKKRASKAAKRLREQLAGVNAYQATFKRKPQLWTFTLRDSGSPGRDALLMREAWVQFRATFHWRYGFAFKFMRYEEITKGRQGQGHNHWHCIVWHHNVGKYTLSQFNADWRRALEYAAEKGGISCDGGAVHVSKSKGPAETAIAYAGKVYAYISKESFELEDLVTDKARDYLEALYGRRRFTTSRYLLLKQVGPGRFAMLGLREWRPGDPGGIDAAESAARSAPAASTGPPGAT